MGKVGGAAGFALKLAPQPSDLTANAENRPLIEYPPREVGGLAAIA